MKKVLAAAATAVLLGAVAPVVSHAATGGAAAPVPARRVSSALAATLASGTSTPLRVLVQASSRDSGIAAVRAAGLHLDDVLESVGVSVATGPVDAVRALTRDSRVTYVEQDQALRLFGDDTADIATRTAEARAADSPVLKQTTTDGRHGNGNGNGGAGQGNGEGNTTGVVTTTAGPYTGAGESIAIVDSGVDGTHPMFMKDGVSKVVVNMKLACTNDGPFVLPDTCPTGPDVDPFFVDLTPVNDSDTPSMGGHGTHVAGIAAGYPVTTSDGRHLQGTAPGAKIVSLSIGQALSIYGSDAALDWIVRHHDKPCGDDSCPPITVVNNSYGGGATFDPQSATTLLQDAIVKAGVVMVWANGNGDTMNDGGDGSDNRSSSDSMDPIPGSISVANYDHADSGTREGSLDPSSSRGDAKTPATWPDISAPGTNITSSCRPYLAICEGALSADPNYGTISGTSMATPHVAGIVAVLREAGGKDMTPADVQAVIQNTAHKFQFGAPYWLVGSDPSSTSFDKGHGLIDTTAALASVLSRSASTPAPPTCASPILTDSPGDATRAEVVAGEPDGLPNEPQLDIRSTDLAWDATAQALTATVTVDDLQPDNPTGSLGIVFEVDFAYDGKADFLQASREGGAASAYFGGPAATGETVRPKLADAQVHFDPGANTITVTITNAALAGTGVKPFASGASLSGITVLSRRLVGVPRNDALTAVAGAVAGAGGPGIPRALLLTADDGSTSCAFVLGGATTVPDPQPFPVDSGGSGGTSDSRTWYLHRIGCGTTTDQVFMDHTDSLGDVDDCLSALPVLDGPVFTPTPWVASDGTAPPSALPIGTHVKGTIYVETAEPLVQLQIDLTAGADPVASGATDAFVTTGAVGLAARAWVAVPFDIVTTAVIPAGAALSLSSSPLPGVTISYGYEGDHVSTFTLG